MKRNLLLALRATALTLLMTGFAYPLVTTGLALALFPHTARGSLVVDEKGAVVGSELIAQAFANAAYLQPRPSANSYDGLNSGGSNLGPTSKALHDRVEKDRTRLAAENGNAPGPVPVELYAATASGLDPELSPEAALWQAERIARARGITSERVQSVIEAHRQGRTLGILGEPRVNVLLVNLALDRQFGRPRM